MSLIKINNKLIKLSNKLVGLYVDPYNPLGLPPYTLRLKYKPGTTPTFSVGTGTLVDAGQNIWDLTYVDSENIWDGLLREHTDLLEVLGANTTNIVSMYLMFDGCSSLTTVALFDTSSVTNMESMFGGCTSLTTVPLFDTSSVTDMVYMFHGCSSLTTLPLFDTTNVTDMGYMFSVCTSLSYIPLFNTSNVTNMLFMFDNCTSLTSVPLFDTSKVTNMSMMFYGCSNVQSGALALYQQASTQSNPPSNHSGTFYQCGSNTQTGAAELAQIPSSWK